MILIILNLVIIKNLIFQWNMSNAKLRVISNLTHFPLSEPVKIIVKCFLFECFKLLEFKDLSENKLIWCLSSISYSSIFWLNIDLLLFVMEKSILSILREVKILKLLVFDFIILQTLYFCNKIMSLSYSISNHNCFSLLYSF